MEKRRSGAKIISAIATGIFDILLISIYVVFRKACDLLYLGKNTIQPVTVIFFIIIVIFSIMIYKTWYQALCLIADSRESRNLVNQKLSSNRFVRVKIIKPAEYDEFVMQYLAKKAYFWARINPDTQLVDIYISLNRECKDMFFDRVDKEKFTLYYEIYPEEV